MDAELDGPLPSVSVGGSEIHLEQDGRRVVLPLIPLPTVFAEWMDRGRRAMYEQIRGGSDPVRFFPQHLPVVVTSRGRGVFPFNCGNKGVGYLPRPEHLGRFVDLYRETMRSSRGTAWAETLESRVAAVSQLLREPESIDRRCLVTLEIFERRTFENLRRNPLASLLFTGYSPSYTSFQLDCAVEIIGPADPRYAFVRLSRTMFEYDEFHITQKNFPYAYVFWISECTSKTPFRVKRTEEEKEALREKLPWTPEAREAIQRAPSMIRTHIREVVERYANDRGFVEITPEVLREARANLLDGR